MQHVVLKGDSYSYRDFIIIVHYELLSDEIQPPGSVHEKVFTNQFPSFVTFRLIETLLCLH